MEQLPSDLKEQIRKEAKDYGIFVLGYDTEKAYQTGAEAYAIYKQKAEVYEKALREIVSRWKPLGEVECPSGIATKALEQYNKQP